jgi:hypothetical protein
MVAGRQETTGGHHVRQVNNTCPVCNTETRDEYLVTGACWAAAGFTYYQNVHLHCLEEELKQTTCGGLVIEDFPDVPTNFNMPQILKQDVVGLPQDSGAWLDRRAEISRECQRRQNG